MNITEETLTLIDADGRPLADLPVSAADDGWLTGRLLSQQFPPALCDALSWYDEVLDGQMLSYLDGATSAVEKFGLRVRHANGDVRKVYSLHINKQNDVSFRITSVAPRKELVS